MTRLTHYEHGEMSTRLTHYEHGEMSNLGFELSFHQINVHLTTNRAIIIRLSTMFQES